MMSNTSPRLSKKALFDAVGYKPHPGQVLVHRSTAKRRVLACGTRNGKSTCGAMETTVALLAPCETSLGWLVAPTYELTQRIFDKVLVAVSEHFAHRIRVLSPREHRIVLVNAGGGLSELRAKSADRPESLLGEALDFLVIDEAASLRDNVWNEYLAPRLIDRDGWALLLSTPQGANWFQAQFLLGRRDPSYECWRAPTIQNPHIDRDIIEAERLRLAPEVFAQQYEAAFIGCPIETCRTCGGPTENRDHTVILQPEEAPPRCPACDGYVDQVGRTAVNIVNGRPETQFVIVHGPLQCVPELP